MQKLGRKCALRDEEEQLLVAFLVHFARRSEPLSQQHLREAVELIVGRMLPAHPLLLPFSNFSWALCFARSSSACKVYTFC